MITKINDVRVIAPGEMNMEEQLHYVELQKEKYPHLRELVIEVDGEDVCLTSDDRQIKFDRIRRITGYLVGTMDRWNNAKQAEAHDRVKHAIEENMRKA